MLGKHKEEEKGEWWRCRHVMKKVGDGEKGSLLCEGGMS